MGDGFTNRETTDRTSPQDGRLLAHATNLSQSAQETFQPLSWQNTNQEQPTFLDTSMNALYGDNYPILAQTKVFEKPATQAVESMPRVSDSITKAPDASPFALNIQIANVPEVSPAINADQWLNHVNRAFAAGAEAVRPTEKWLATRNAVHDSLIQLGPILDTAVNYYANNRPEQVASDAKGLLNKTGEALDKTFSYPQTPEALATTSGTIMPFVFTDRVGPQGESQTFKAADAVATHVDKAVVETVQQQLNAINELAKTSPECVQQAKTMLYDFLKGKGLAGPEAEYAGVPHGHFDGIFETAKPGDYALKMVGRNAEYIPERKPMFLAPGQNKVLNEREIEAFGGLKKLESMTDGELAGVGLKRYEMPKLKLETDEFSMKATIAGDTKAFARVIQIEPGVINATDIYGGKLPKGAGSLLLAEALKGHGAIPTERLILSNIQNGESIAQFKAGIPPETTMVGRTAANALKQLGITPGSFKYEIEGDHINIVIDMQR